MMLLNCGVGEDSWESLGLQGDPTISSSVIPFSSCLQSFLTSGSFPVSQFFPSSSQSNGASISTLALPMNIQDWFPLGLTGYIFLKSKGLSRVFSNTTVHKHQFFGASAFFIVQLSHSYMSTTKTITLTSQTFVGKVMSLLFNMLSRLVITFKIGRWSWIITWAQCNHKGPKKWKRKAGKKKKSDGSMERT